MEYAETADAIVGNLLQQAGEDFPADPDAEDTYCLSAGDLESLLQQAVERARARG